MIPDAEHVIGRYLAGREDLAALGLAGRILGAHPKDRRMPWVRYVLLDATDQTAPADHLISFLLQLDCYAGATGIDGSQRKQATLIARTLRQALKEMPGARDGAVVTASRITGMVRLPDTEMEPARERVVLTATVWMHP